MAVTSTCSDWCAVSELLAAWSSPQSSRAPPFRCVPSKFAALIASPARSTPTPLAYHSAKTPSTRGLPYQPSCCVPRSEVAQFLVQPRFEADVVLGQQLLRRPELRIERGDRRAAVAGDIACRLEPGGTVAPGLVEQQAHHTLQR